MPFRDLAPPKKEGNSASPTGKFSHSWVPKKEGWAWKISPQPEHQPQLSSGIIPALPLSHFLPPLHKLLSPPQQLIKLYSVWFSGLSKALLSSYPPHSRCVVFFNINICFLTAFLQFLTPFPTSITHQFVYSGLSTVPLSSFPPHKRCVSSLTSKYMFSDRVFQYLTPSKCVSFAHLLKFADINMF